MHWTPGSSGNVCDSGDTETFYTIWRSGVNPGSISGGLAIQFQCNQILLRTHRSTRHYGLTSLLSPSQGGKGWRSRKRFRKFIVYILFVAMRSPGKKDSPRRPADSQVSWLSFTSIYPSPFLQPLFPTLPQPAPTGRNTPALHFLEALSLPTQGSVFPLVLLSVSEQGACNNLCTSHICTVQSRSLQPQCFSLSIKAFLCKQGPQQLHLHGSLTAPLNTLWDRAGCLYILVSYF